MINKRTIKKIKTSRKINTRPGDYVLPKFNEKGELVKQKNWLARAVDISGM